MGNVYTKTNRIDTILVIVQNKHTHAVWFRLSTVKRCTKC